MTFTPSYFVSNPLTVFVAEKLNLCFIWPMLIPLFRVSVEFCKLSMFLLMKEGLKRLRASHTAGWLVDGISWSLWRLGVPKMSLFAVVVLSSALFSELKCFYYIYFKGIVGTTKKNGSGNFIFKIYYILLFNYFPHWIKWKFGLFIFSSGRLARCSKFWIRYMLFVL